MYVARFEPAPLTLYPAHSRVGKNNLGTWHSLSTQDCHILPDVMDDRSHYHLDQKSSIIPAKHMRREQQKDVAKAQSVDQPFGMLS